MKLVEAQILDELKGLLCEDVRELVPVAVLEAWPSGYVPAGSKRFAPLGPEEKKQFQSSDDTVMQVHTSSLGAGEDFDDPKIGEPLYRDCDICDGTGFGEYNEQGDVGKCEECEGKGYTGGLTRDQLNDLFMLRAYMFRDPSKKWPFTFRPPPEIREMFQQWLREEDGDAKYKKLRSDAEETRKQFRSMYNRATYGTDEQRANIDHEVMYRLQTKAEHAHEKADEYFNSNFVNMTRHEMDQIRDDYWIWAKNIAQAKAKKNIDKKGVTFKEVDPKILIKQAVEETLKEYMNSSISMMPNPNTATGQTFADQLSGIDIVTANNQLIIRSPYPYVSNLFNTIPDLTRSYVKYRELINSQFRSGERSDYFLSPEEILQFAKLGAFRPGILEKLTGLQVSILDQEEVANLERIIREVAENLEEAGDFKAKSFSKPKIKSDWDELSPKELERMADIYNIKDPDLALQHKRREEEKLKEYYRQYYEEQEDLQEARRHIIATPGGGGDLDLIPSFVPMDDDRDTSNDEFDVSRLPRQSWDKRPRPSEVSEDVTWIQLAGFDYSGYDPKRSRWEPPFGKTEKGLLSGQSEPYHAVLEWLWQSLLKVNKEPEPYDGFARVPDRTFLVNGEEDAPTEVMFYNPSVPYLYRAQRTEGGIGSTRRNVIYGINRPLKINDEGEVETDDKGRELEDEDAIYSRYYKRGPDPDQVPVPDKVLKTSASPDTMNVEKYNVLFKVEPSFGRKPSEVKKEISNFISQYYNELVKRGIVAKVFVGENLGSDDYETKYDPEGHRAIQAQYPSPFIKIMFYAYRLTRDDSDDLLDFTSSQTFWKETEKFRERLRSAKIFQNTKTIEELADLVDEHPEIFRLYNKPWPADLIRFSIGSGSIEGLNKKGKVIRSPIGRFFNPNQLKAMSDRVVRDASRRKGADPFDQPSKPTDWDFPVQILKSAIEDLQAIYAQAGGSAKEAKAKIQQVIEGLNNAIDNAAASNQELKRRARGRAQEKEMDWWRKEGAAKDAALRYRRQNEIRHNIIKSKIALSHLMSGVKISDSDLYSYKIFDLIKDMVKQHERLNKIEVWDDRYPYDSFLRFKQGFEREIIEILQEKAAQRGSESQPPIIGDQELHPETYSLFTDIEDNPKSDNYGRPRFSLEYGIHPRLSLNGEPITSYQRDQQLDSKEDALALFYQELKKIKDEIFSSDKDNMIYDLERLIED